MQPKTILASVIAALVVTPSIATVTETDRKTVTSKGYVDTTAATKQAKFTTTGTDKAVTYPATSGGTPTSRTINSAVGSSTSDTNLVTTGAVNSALNTKQGLISGTNGNVMTYGSGNGANPGSKAVYNGSTYNSAALVEAQHVNGAVTRGFNAHLTCAEYQTPNDSSSPCLIWNVNSLNGGTYVPTSNN